MDGGIVRAGCAVAKFPKEVVGAQVDVGMEGQGLQGTVADRVIGMDGDVVDENRSGKVGGLRSYHVGIASGIAKTVDVGVDAVGTTQLVHTMVDSLAVKTVLVVASHSLKLVGGQQLIV